METYLLIYSYCYIVCTCVCVCYLFTQERSHTTMLTVTGITAQLVISGFTSILTQERDRTTALSVARLSV